jgi:hypothetical protein
MEIQPVSANVLSVDDDHGSAVRRMDVVKHPILDALIPTPLAVDELAIGAVVDFSEEVEISRSGRAGGQTAGEDIRQTSQGRAGPRQTGCDRECARQDDRYVSRP